MSWIKENKFLAGFTAATVVGAGALGYLTLQAKSAYDTATASYEEQSSELSRLQGAQPFPSADNVKTLEEQRKQHQEAIGALQERLAKVELPIEELTPFQFQDRLRQTVDNTRKRAADSGIEIPDNFSLGFDRYLAEPPSSQAAGPLGRQLKAIESVVANVINSRVSKISSLDREELPEEKGGTREPQPAKGAKGGKTAEAQPLVEKYPFQITFVSNQGSMMQVLNNVVNSDKQFYIPRLITVKNEKETGPSRAETAQAPTAPAAPAPGVPADPGAFPGAPAPAPGAEAIPGVDPAAAAGMFAAPVHRTSPYVVGEEKAEVTMRIEIVDFANKATASK